MTLRDNCVKAWPVNSTGGFRCENQWWAEFRRVEVRNL